MRYLRVLLVVLACALGAGAAWAQEAGPTVDQKLAAFAAEADRIAGALERGDLSDPALEQARAALEGERRALSTIAEAAAARLAPLRAQRDALAPAEDGAPMAAEVEIERERLGADIEAISGVKSRAEQGLARATALLDRLNNLRITRFREQLLRRGPSPLNPDRLGALGEAVDGPFQRIRAEFLTRLAVGGAMQSLVDRLALPILIAVVALIFGVGVRRWLVRRLKAGLSGDMKRSRRLAVAAGITLARLFLPAAAVLLTVQGLLHSGLMGPTGELVLRALTQGMLVVIAAFALGGTYFAPGAGAIRLSVLDDGAAAAAHRWLIGLALVVALDRIFVRAGVEAGLPIDVLAGLNAGVLILGGIMLWRFVRASKLGQPEGAALGAAPDEPDDDEAGPPLQPIALALRAARTGLRVVAVLSPLLALAGYYAASRYLFYPAVISAALIGLCVLIYAIVNEVSTALRGEVEPGKAAPPRGLAVLPVLSGFLLAIGAMPLLALIWGATPTDLETIWAQLVEGFRVGETVISPLDFLLFVVVFAIGYMVTRALQGVVRRSVLPLTRFDDGAKSAMVAGMGYVGVAVSALVAISTTGLDLSSLAIVAGALSVGIGFGLQNIVNNFVSGIILLIERPIKVGDWVEIGGVHGTVQQVNVRSTEIMTFERSSMFVPNADLISGTVTNWTHSNNHGRIIVGVSVAYGTDARTVEKILQEVAEGHPMLMRRPAPYVIFTNFGADGLDFEIRGVLRDVNWILNVASDLRFKIYERLNEEGIEIPFAQRDIHIRNADELGAAFRGERPPAGDQGGAGEPER